LASHDDHGHDHPHDDAQAHGRAAHHHGHDQGHGHTHGTVDPALLSTAQGISAVKWSLVILAITAAIQIVVVLLTGSVALLADTVHNVGDALTAVPLWIAFSYSRRPPTKRYTYGFGRIEDLAGIAVVLTILFSAVFAGYESVLRIVHPQTVTHLGAVAVAALVGFLGNEAVAQLRIRTGKRIASVALIADGHHARIDGFTSLAVLAGAIGVWLGFPLADPIVGLLIALAILRIVWLSARSVLSRAIDGVDPEVVDEIHGACGNARRGRGHRDASALARPPHARRGERRRAGWSLGRGRPRGRGGGAPPAAAPPRVPLGRDRARRPRHRLRAGVSRHPRASARRSAGAFALDLSAQLRCLTTATLVDARPSPSRKQRGRV